MSAQTVEEKLAELATLTGLSVDEIRDFCACTEAQQELIAQGYRDQSWAKSPDTVKQVLAVLTVVAGFAGIVSGIAGAGTAVAVLVRTL